MKKATVKWLFDVDWRAETTASELAFGRTKSFLYENLHHALTKHQLDKCFKLLRLLPKETSFDPYILFKFVMILLESNPSHDVNKNFIIYLESQLNKLNLCKPEVFVEFLAYFVRHNRIEDAKEMFTQRKRFITSSFHRTFPIINDNLRCYEFLFQYLSWKEKADIELECSGLDVSAQGWVVNIIDCLKSVKGNYEYFVMCVVNVLLYHGYSKKAYIFASEFQRHNQNNFSAQIILYRLIKLLVKEAKKMDIKQRLELMDCDTSEGATERRRQSDLDTINNFTDLHDEIFEPDNYPLDNDHLSILDNLRRLDMSRGEIYKLNKKSGNILDMFRDLMDGMEHLKEISNSRRWKRIRQVINIVFESGDNALVESIRFMWQNRYQRYWSLLDFTGLVEGKVSEKDRQLIKEVENLLNTRLG